MAEQWIWERDPARDARFVLGTVGADPLVCVGVNPSTAVPDHLDLTVTKVREFARRNGFDSWVMLNLHPQISTDPSGMHLVRDPDLMAENLRHIEAVVGGRPLKILGAWGGLITTRPYLRDALGGVLSVTDAAGCEWLTLGTPIAGGHPRHPSRPGYSTPLVPFDMGAYRRQLGV